MNIFNYIKAHISILDVVKEYAQLKKAGLYWKAPCPFHNEKDASFTVSPHREIFYCFGCHAGGDVISFIEKVEGATPLEAAKFLVDRYNIDIPENIELAKIEGNSEEKKIYFNLCQEVSSWAHQELLRSHEALEYLSARKINKKSIENFNLGYFPGGQQGVRRLLNAVKKKNIMPHDLMDAHIINEGKGYMYSAFEERIMFPICDHLGRHCGFGGRIFKINDERAKYYNTRENAYFQKGKIIFGLDRAKNFIQKKGEVLLVEGYTDCIAMHQHGYCNAVSTLGTACTLDHLNFLARYADSLVILYDGDSAGQNAFLRLVEFSWQASLDLKVVTLPKGEDPASFLASRKELGLYIDHAHDIFHFFVDSLESTFKDKSLSEKVVSVRKLLSIIANIDDKIKRSILLQQASSALNISLQTLEEELKNIKGSRSKGNTIVNQNGTGSESVLPRISMLEKKVFFAIMSNIQIFNSDDDGLVSYFSEPFRSVLKLLQQAKTENAAIDFVQFFDHLDKEHQKLISGIMLESEHEIDAKRLEELLDQFKRKHWKLLVRTLKEKIDSADPVSEDKKQLLHDFLELKKSIFKDRM